MKRRLGVGRLGRNTILFGAGLGIRAVIQAAYLVLLSRWMGPEGYGYFSGSVAAAMILSPLAGFGVSFLVSSLVGRDRSATGALWATAVVQIALSGVLLTGLLMVTTSWVLDHRLSTGAMLALALAELFALPIANAAVGISLAAERGLATTLLTCLVPSGRLVMVSALIFSGTEMTPDNVVGMHLLGSVIGAAAAYFVLARMGVRPDWSARIPSLSATRQGFSHAVGTLVGASYLELDKVVMLQFLEPSTVGAYTAAFRATVLFILPVSALVVASVPRLCAAAGSASEPGLRRAIAVSLGGYSAAAVLVAALASPLLPVVFGEEFAASSMYMLMLAPWIAFYALHQYLGTRLTTSNLQGARVSIESVGFLILLALNLELIPQLAAGGAVISLLVAEALMIAAMAWVVVTKCK